MEDFTPLLMPFLVGIFFGTILSIFTMKNDSLREEEMGIAHPKICYCCYCSDKRKEQIKKEEATKARQTKVCWYKEGEAIPEGAKYLDRKVVDEGGYFIPAPKNDMRPAYRHWVSGTSVEYFLYEVKE